jgi:hypothetical protein
MPHAVESLCYNEKYSRTILFFSNEEAITSVILFIKYIVKCRLLKLNCSYKLIDKNNHV